MLPADVEEPSRTTGATLAFGQMAMNRRSNVDAYYALNDEGSQNRAVCFDLGLPSLTSIHLPTEGVSEPCSNKTRAVARVHCLAPSDDLARR